MVGNLKVTNIAKQLEGVLHTKGQYRVLNQ